MSYPFLTYHWPLLSRPQVAGFKCPVTSMQVYSNKLPLDNRPWTTPIRELWNITCFV